MTIATSVADAARPGAAVHSRTGALVLLFLLALVWGTHWSIVKIGLRSMPPLTYATLRIASGLAVIAVVLASQRRLRLPPRSDLPVVASVGLGAIATGVITMNLALQVIPAGRSSVLVYSMPLWVAVLLAVVFRVRPRRSELIGLVLGIAGIGALLNPAAIDWSVPGEIWGTLALLGNAAVWAGVTIHVRRHHWSATPLDLLPFQLLVALVPVTICAALLEAGAEVRWDLVTVAVLLYSGPLATAFANWASQSITRSLGSLASGMGFLAVPVVGLASGALILGESLGFVDLLGFGLVLAGVAAASLMPQSPAAPDSPV